MGFLTAFLAGFRSPERRNVSFAFTYRPSGDTPLTVGTLVYDGATWSFEYDEAYKRRDNLRPLEGFGDLNSVYSSTRLFPFFRVRLPDPKRPDIRREMERQNLRGADEVEMLRVFGRKVASSPGCELVTQP